jgi:hypothetical protein
MNISARASCKAFEEIVDQFHLQIAHSHCADFGIDYGSRASSEIDCR